MNIEPKSLYMKDNNGAIREWRIGVIGTTIVVEHGVKGGSMQSKTEKVEAGKAGRTVEDQIMLQVASKISRQRDKGYRKDLALALLPATNTLGLKKPMLAQALKNVKGMNMDGAFIQPKFDGNRCIITKQHGKMLAYSRNGKIIAANLDHIFVGLDLSEGDYVDGELYCHGHSLQTIVSWIKRDQEQTKKLKFHAYDIMIDSPYNERYWELESKISGDTIILTETNEVTSISAAWDAHKHYTENGYEGVIIRWSDAGYEDGKRSKSLVKVKTFLDDIFHISDIMSSKDGWARLKCDLPNGKSFMVSAPGNMFEKTYIYTHRHMYIGKDVHVEFMNFTKEGIPFHPVATEIIGR